MDEKNEEKAASDMPSVEKEEEKELTIKEKKEQPEKMKMKNYVSIIILLAGLLLGSIFVDVAQFFSRQGVSPRVLKSVDVFPFEGKTWVAYNEPVVNVQVVTDSKCDACDATEPLKWLKRVMPTLLAKKVEIDSPEGSDLVSSLKIKNIPAFVFDDSVTKTDVYAQAQSIFSKNGNNYLMDTNQVGIKPGKFLETPTVSDNDAQVGPKDAKVKLVLFSDFQCPYCQSFYEQDIKKAMTDYKDKVLFVFKEVPLPIHDKAVDAAMAAECAGDQGKFWDMADKLYSDQKTWSAAKTFSATPYASAISGLNMAQFNQCVTSKKFQDKINADSQTAQDFGISGTPSFFVNDQFFGGVVPYDQLKKTLDGELAK